MEWGKATVNMYIRFMNTRLTLWEKKKTKREKRKMSHKSFIISYLAIELKNIF